MLYFPNAITFSITSSISVARYDLAEIDPAMQYSTVFIDFCELKGYSLNSLLYSTVNIPLRYILSKVFWTKKRLLNTLYKRFCGF